MIVEKKIRKTSTVRQKSHDLSRFVAIDVLTFAGLMHTYYASTCLKNLAQARLCTQIRQQQLRSFGMWAAVT